MPFEFREAYARTASSMIYLKAESNEWNELAVRHGHDMNELIRIHMHCTKLKQVDFHFAMVALMNTLPERHPHFVVMFIRFSFSSLAFALLHCSYKNTEKLWFRNDKVTV